MVLEDDITAVRATGELPATGGHARALGQILIRGRSSQTTYC